MQVIYIHMMCIGEERTMFLARVLARQEFPPAEGGESLSNYANGWNTTQKVTRCFPPRRVAAHVAVRDQRCWGAAWSQAN